MMLPELTRPIFKFHFDKCVQRLSKLDLNLFIIVFLILQYKL